jgi:hypothetical protein
MYFLRRSHLLKDFLSIASHIKGWLKVDDTLKIVKVLHYHLRELKKI